MIVDDEVGARNDMLECIDWRRNGMFVIGTAEDGLTAYEKISRLKPDIVLIDIQMPGMSGLQVINRIRNEQRISPAFIIISGHDDFYYAQQAIRLSVDEYLLKPFMPKDVIHAINKSIKRLEMFNQIPSETAKSSFTNFYCTFFEQDVSSSAQEIMNYPMDEERDLINSMLIGSYEETLDCLNAFSNKVEKENKSQVMLIHCFLLVYVEIFRILVDRQIELPQSFFTLFELVSAHDINIVHSLKQHLRSIVTDTHHLLNTNKESNLLIRNAIEYIKNHYNENLSLDFVAQKLYVSPAYLSSLFKPTLGVTFIDYVHLIRIEKAKKLLSNTNYKNYEIAEYIGYDNSKYFTKVFKKLTGITPTQFREQSGPYIINDS